MMRPAIGRRSLGLGAASIVTLGRSALAAPALPKSPVSLNIVDVAGVLAQARLPIENYRKAKPNLLSRVSMTKAPAPELPGKIKAQQSANRADVDLVIGGYDQMAAGSDQDLWIRLLPDYADALPNLDAILLEPARKIQDLAQGQGVCIHYSPYGPLLEFMPSRVNQMPQTAEDLLAWSRQNKNRLLYARPSNSGPARSLMTGLPYILGDSDPRDPIKGWEKTWSYLQALGENIEYYPSGTGDVLREFGDGSRDIIPSTTGWDINPRALGIVPEAAKISTLKGFHWGSDGHFACIPKGISNDKLAVLLDLISWMMTPEQQAYAFDDGYFYPGPAVKGVALAMAPPESRKIIDEFGRPEYAALIADNPVDTPLKPEPTVQAFRRWDQQIGAAKSK